MQVESFLVRFPPFDNLEPGAVERIAAATQIGFFPEGDTILTRGGPPSAFLYVVRTGAVELLDDGTVIDLLEEGELFGHPSLIAGLPPTFSVRSVEDTLCYLIDRTVADEVLRTRSGIEFLAHGLARRGRLVAQALEADRVVRPPPPISALIHRGPITCPPETTVGDAASTMTEERVSSIVVIGDDLLGIVTDRDLRSKVVATGRDLGAPVTDVMSAPVITVRSDATADDALRVMLERGFHHLPVAGPEGRIVGVVSDTELMGLERTASFGLLRALDRASSADEVTDAMSRLPRVAASVVMAGLDPVDVGHVIASAIDTATRRLIHLAIADLGDPPGPWAWLALGSAARHEQSLDTDQDHALVFLATDVSFEEADGYFEDLARRVTDGLVAAGIPRCRGGVMAESPAWRADRDRWLVTFRTQLAEPDIGGTAFSNIALDFRRVAGSLEVETEIERLVRDAARRGGLLRRLASTALNLRPPTGFLRDFVLESEGEQAGTLDVKHGGITPVTNLARTFAVATGSSSNRTIERLRAAVAAGGIDADLGVGLEEAFRLLWRIRLEHQTSQLDRGETPDDAVDPRRLGALTRRSLREAFRLIAAGQRLLATTYGIRMR
jgi:CBS domain-containing protein